ncbi:hypothetical protein [Companilactobacillus halodurans]|uniref:Uncharacterized protein n=1 Tax=Companilactobacillus halodurans TaxID=2584183 RepID=A0A5P0ZW52_9LACO|nr:hypothetical protein [Companilactobacillus halodurans]MQS74856.1 hypothetical protein [Companilactobacillus halodurans]MQS97251.1 hypothetical protein [Companilactobacillus halodurans]
MNLIQLHDFIKENYEDGTFQSTQDSYRQVKNDYQASKDFHASTEDDYQLGYQQAMSDYRRDHAFRYYPKSLLRFANEISDNKLIEITNFIDGYKNAQKDISKKL